MKFEKLKPGTVVFDVGKRKMGNTNISTVSVWPVGIVSVDPETRTVMARWNGNPPRKFREPAYKKWRAEKPMLVSVGFGAMRLATREEIAAAKGVDK